MSEYKKVEAYRIRTGALAASSNISLSRVDVPGIPTLPNEHSRGAQRDANSFLCSMRHGLLIGPTGWGKTIVALIHAQNTLSAEPCLKAVFSVPQEVIGAGYRSASRLQVPGHGEVEWVMPSDTDLCGQDKGEATEKLVAFLASPADQSTPCQRSSICTHSLLCCAFRSIEEDPEYWLRYIRLTCPHVQKWNTFSGGARELLLELFEDLLLVVDEIHHAAGEDEANFNVLGKIIRLACASRRSKILAMTATFFRGDKQNIIPKAALASFAQFRLPYDEYLSKMVSHLQNFRTFFVYYKSSYAKAIAELLQEVKPCGRRFKTIVYLPPQSWGISTGDKFDDLDVIMRALYGCPPPDPDKETGVHTLPDGRKMVVLIDENGRAAQKKFFAKEEAGEVLINQDKGRLDIIITIGMAQEGFNWHHAERVIEVGARVLWQKVQINGRVLRDVLGKPEAESIVLLPAASVKLNEAHHKWLVNNYLKAMYMAMLNLDLYDPISIVNVNEETKERGDYMRRPNHLGDFLDSHPSTSPEELLAMTYAMSIDLQKTGMSSGACRASYLRDMVDSLSKMPGSDGPDLEEVAKKLWIMACRPCIPRMSARVREIRFEELGETSPAMGMEAFCSEIGVGTSGGDASSANTTCAGIEQHAGCPTRRVEALGQGV